MSTMFAGCASSSCQVLEESETKLFCTIMGIETISVKNYNIKLDRYLLVIALLVK